MSLLLCFLIVCPSFSAVHQLPFVCVSVCSISGVIQIGEFKVRYYFEDLLVNYTFILSVQLSQKGKTAAFIQDKQCLEATLIMKDPILKMNQSF